MFLEHQIGILEWFLKDHVTLKTVIGCWKISFVYIDIFSLFADGVRWNWYGTGPQSLHLCGCAAIAE